MELSDSPSETSSPHSSPKNTIESSSKKRTICEQAIFGNNDLLSQNGKKLDWCDPATPKEYGPTISAISSECSNAIAVRNWIGVSLSVDLNEKKAYSLMLKLVELLFNGPTILAVDCGAYDYRCLFSSQPEGTELQNMISNHLMRFRRNVHFLPDRIIFYRYAESPHPVPIGLVTMRARHYIKADVVYPPLRAYTHALLYTLPAWELAHPC